MSKYDFSRIDFSDPAVVERLSRAFAVLLIEDNEELDAPKLLPIDKKAIGVKKVAKRKNPTAFGYEQLSLF